MANGANGREAPPNILLITCDQYRFPRFSYGPDGGFDEPIEQILGFQGRVDDSNPYALFFPGLLGEASYPEPHGAQFNADLPECAKGPGGGPVGVFAGAAGMARSLA